MSFSRLFADGVAPFRNRRGEAGIFDRNVRAEEAPPIRIITGSVHAIKPLPGDVIKLVISSEERLKILPGQHVQVCFSGFPARYYSPTVPLRGPIDRDNFYLHVRRIPNGCISSAIGASIRPGHKVEIAGPYGAAYLRRGLTNRLVLVSSGAGFAPIWSIAHAALRETPDREIVVIVEATDRSGLYMANTLVRLAAHPNVQVIPVIGQRDAAKSAFWTGDPLVFMPRLSSSDIIHVSGAPLMVEGVASIARTAGALCHLDPFVPAERETASSFAWA